MKHRNPAKKQPESFAFSATNLKKAREIIAKYPAGRQQSAVIPLLDIAQRQCENWVPIPAMQAIAQLLDMPYIRVYEVASFYSMFNLEPVGKHFIQVCRTTPCWLRGSNKITKACEKKLGVKNGQTTKDDQFTLVEVECLGACVNAPMVQINDDYYEDLTPESMERLIEDLETGKKVQSGPQIDRQTSAPSTGLTSLKE